MTRAPRVRVLLVDDEPIARSGMRALCARDPELEVVGECADGPEAIAGIARDRPDVVLLDVQMPGLDGFGVLRALDPQHVPIVIFVTAFDRFALQAFDAHALDYLLKPFADDRFAASLERAKSAVRTRSNAALGRRLQDLVAQLGDGAAGSAGSPAVEGGFATRLVVRERERTLLIRTMDIDWVEAADYYSAVHAGGRRHLLRESMASLEQRLDPALFFRTHRSAIVNLDRVRELQPFFGGELVIVLQNGTQVRLSRGRRAALEARLGRPL